MSRRRSFVGLVHAKNDVIGLERERLALRRWIRANGTSYLIQIARFVFIENERRKRWRFDIDKRARRSNTDATFNVPGFNAMRGILDDRTINKVGTMKAMNDENRARALARTSWPTNGVGMNPIASYCIKAPAHSHVYLAIRSSDSLRIFSPHRVSEPPIEYL